MTDAHQGPPLTRRERRERERAAAAAAESASGQPPALVEPPSGSHLAPTQAIDVSDLLDSQHAPAAPPQAAAASDAPQQQDVEEVFAEVTEASDEPSERPEPAKSGFGRLFGRKDRDDRSAESAASESASDVVDEVVEAEVIEPTTPTVSSPPTRPVPPSRPIIPAQPRTPVTHDQIPELDLVDDDEIDRIEIDEVQVDGRRISAHRIAEATPAELDDRHKPEAHDDIPAGPSRAAARKPVIVNVVEDTSEHHIADLRTESGTISAASVGTGTSAITANALVLPASGGIAEPIQVEGADGVIVTGSIDLPDGFASSGRSRGSIDTSDVDQAEDPGELRTPETQPVRASKAVSSYANARVRIAPQRRNTNLLPYALGVGGGIVAVGIAVVATLAITLNWF